MPLAELIAQNSQNLTPAERRIAQIVLEQPQLVAFGTIVELSKVAGVGVATVARLSSKLGFAGFSALQSHLQQNMVKRLLPAAARIKEHAISSITQHLQLEIDNLHQTFERLDEKTLSAVVNALSELTARILLLSGNASSGVTQQFVEDLSALRPNVQYIHGNPVQVGRDLAQLSQQDVVLVLDLCRYDTWLVSAVQIAYERGAHIITVLDSALSPLAQYAKQVLIVTAGGTGPFDSHVGTLALFNVINAAVALQLKSSASQRLEQAETTWHSANLLVER